MWCPLAWPVVPRGRNQRPHLLLLQFGDLLLHHGDLAVDTIHVLDQLLLGQPWRLQLQLRVGMWWAGWGHWLQLARQAPVLGREHKLGAIMEQPHTRPRQKLALTLRACVPTSTPPRAAPP